MSAIPSNRPESESGDSDLSTTYVLVIIVEIIVIASLYWLGRYFG